MSNYDNVTDRISNPDYSFPLADIDLQWIRFLNPQGYAICSGAINPTQPVVERLMADN